MTRKFPEFLMDKSNQIIRGMSKESSSKDDDHHAELWRGDKSPEESKHFIDMVYGRPVAFSVVVRPQLSLDAQADDATVEKLFGKHCALYYTKAEQVTAAQLQIARNECFGGWFDYRPRPAFGPQLLGEIDIVSLHNPQHLQFASCRKTDPAFFCDVAQTHRMVCRVLDEVGRDTKGLGNSLTLRSSFRSHFMLVDLENTTNDGFVLVKINTKGLEDQSWVYAREAALSYCKGSSWRVMAALIQQIDPTL